MSYVCFSLGLKWDSKKLLLQSVFQNTYLNQNKNASICILAVAFKFRGFLSSCCFLIYISYSQVRLTDKD